MSMMLGDGDYAALQTLLAGAWVFRRTIWGGDDAPQAQASGDCEFAARGPALLHYGERGRLQMAQGRPIAFSRRFDYHFDRDGVLVVFADGGRAGQPYQRYRLAGNRLTPATPHLCGADTYDASYLFDSALQFQLETWIRGPHKHTRVLTHYRRDDTGRGPASAFPA